MSKKAQQKIMGVIFIALAIISVLVTKTQAGTYDGTAALLLLPFGLFCLFSRNIYID